MLIAFSLRDGRLQQQDVSMQNDLPADALWVDLINPTEEERGWVGATYNQLLPQSEEVGEIEASARCYDDESGLNIHSYFLQDFPAGPHNITVAFLVNSGKLFTLHTEDVGAFRAFRARAKKAPGGQIWDANSVLLELFELKIERLADVIEHLYAELDTLSQDVLMHEEKDMRKVLSVLSRHEDVNGKIRMSLMDKQRVMAFLQRSRSLNSERTTQLREILRDIQSLLSHSTFLFEKERFLMDAARGFINIEQNQIIKTFSIAAVVFLPPTLIASIYGMNFASIPELSWAFGYPLAILMMIASGIAPYLFFKRKGWL